jgi:hypothetical protein
MKRWICSALLLAACGGAQAADRPGGNAEIAQFIKENGRFVSQLDEDVTGDGVPDAIIVMANHPRFEVTVTVLMRLRGKPVAGTRPMEGFQGIDALTLELTPLGPPTVKVVKGVLIIDSITGGNTVRTATTYRYRFDADEGQMRLIGLDAERTSTTFGARLSWNALTGTHLFRSGERDGAKARYGPESRSVYKLGTVYMSLSPKPDELIDRALAGKRK